MRWRRDGGLQAHDRADMRAEEWLKEFQPVRPDALTTAEHDAGPGPGYAPGQRRAELGQSDGRRSQERTARMRVGEQDSWPPLSRPAARDGLDRDHVTRDGVSREAAGLTGTELHGFGREQLEQRRVGREGTNSGRVEPRGVGREGADWGRAEPRGLGRAEASRERVGRHGAERRARGRGARDQEPAGPQFGASDARGASGWSVAGYGRGREPGPVPRPGDAEDYQRRSAEPVPLEHPAANEHSYHRDGYRQGRDWHGRGPDDYQPRANGYPGSREWADAGPSVRGGDRPERAGFEPRPADHRQEFPVHGRENPGRYGSEQDYGSSYYGDRPAGLPAGDARGYQQGPPHAPPELDGQPWRQSERPPRSHGQEMAMPWQHRAAPAAGRSAAGGAHPVPLQSGMEATVSPADDPDDVVTFPLPVILPTHRTPPAGPALPGASMLPRPGTVEAPRGPFEPARPPSVTGSVPPPPLREMPAAAAAKLDQLKDLYLTAEAIGEEALDKHFEQVSARQRELIREFFQRSSPDGGDS